VYFNWAVGAKDNGTYETFRPLNILGFGDKTSAKSNSDNVGIGRKSWRSKYNPKESVNVTKIYFNGVVLERYKLTDGDMMRVQVSCIDIDFIIIFVSVVVTRVMEESLIARLSTTRCIIVMCLRQKPHLRLDEQRDRSNSWPLRRYEVRNGELGDPYSTYSRLSQRPRHNLLHNATENKSNTTYL
jgi:hypothetical protein